MTCPRFQVRDRIPVFLPRSRGHSLERPPGEVLPGQAEGERGRKDAAAE
jgi:hypothetical protein